MSRKKPDMRYVGPMLDARIRQVQQDAKNLGCGDLPYWEAGERLAAVKPIILPTINFQQGGKKKGKLDLFGNMGIL